MVYNSLMISLNEGRLFGSLSQHFLINFDQLSGVFGGIGGLRSLLSTYSDTLVPLLFLYGGSLDAIYQRMIE